MMEKVLNDARATELWAAVKEYVDAGTTFSTDDTLTTTAENVLGVTTPVKRVLTQSEFDALPEAEQKKGLYVIPGEGSGSSGGSSEGEVYSTEETRIGTWIDGKPIYRKVLDIPRLTFSGSNNHSILPEGLFPENIDNLLFYRGYLTRSNKEGHILVPGAYYIVRDSSGIVMFALDYFGTVTGKMCIEYTKTTDQGVATS